MRFTLVPLIVCAAVAPMTADAQKPVPVPSPKEAPKPKLLDVPFMLDKIEIERHAERMKLDMHDMKVEIEHLAHVKALEMEHLKFDASEIRMKALDAARNIDVEKLRFEALEKTRDALLDLPVKVAIKPGFGHRESFLETRPRAAWAPGDPADSLYRLGREALNRGEYRRAAQLFNEVITKYRESDYAVHCAYWEAFSRYRTGSTEDLRAARKILDDWRAQFASLRNEGSVDVASLRTRVQGALAARGDEAARREVERNAPENGTSCDREEVSVRAEALSALGQMDPAAALPAARKVLARRDECTVELRRRALYVIGRQSGPEALPVFFDVAKNDTDSGIRNEAMRWLARVAGDNAIPQLEEMLRTAPDEQAQRSVISALGSMDSERARRAIRAIIERNDAAERVRYEAIITLSREKDGRTISTEEQNYLRALYARVETPRLKEAVLTSVSRIEAPESEQFLLAVARNTNEAPSLRSAALQRLGRMSTVSVNDIARLYDVADSRSLREQILRALGQRKEPEAIDKIIEIARKDTDPQVRRAAINVLQHSNNPRAIQFMKEFFDKP